VHGGGFAGTIQAFIPEPILDAYLKQMRSIFSSDACHVLNIRTPGAIHVQF